MITSSKRQAHPNGHAQGRHAVVLGGSLAGLLAARVLSDHFDEVTLIERDVYTETTEVRRGIPQANPRVKIMNNTDVLRVIPDAEKNRVAGVLICPRHSESDRRVATELRADLVVDTTGCVPRSRVLHYACWPMF